MKKNFLILLILCSIVAPATAMQKTFSDGSSTGYEQPQKAEKIYNEHGSLVEYRVAKNNNTVVTYNRYHQKTGYYKRQEGGKIKYYRKK